jgi:hypothetical protein
MPKYKEYEPVSDLSAFLKYVEKEKRMEEKAGNPADFIFRGKNKNDPLLPNLALCKWHGDVFKTEKLILEEFRRITPRLTNLAVRDDWDVLAVAQHHGLPTRLLDWTYSALAAMWFAVNEGLKEDDKNKAQNGFVWILKPAKEDFINFSTYTGPGPFDERRSWIFRPRVIADRIHAQSGVFTCHAAIKDHNGKDRFIALEKNSNFSSKLVKIPLRSKDFGRLRKQLDLCGVNHATMFPDLDGICRHLTWRYTVS